MNERIFNIFYPFLVQEGVLFQFIDLIGCDLITYINEKIMLFEQGLKVVEETLFTTICRYHLFPLFPFSNTINYVDWDAIENKWLKHFEHQLYLLRLGQDFETNIL